jgi:hypothetical protein
MTSPNLSIYIRLFIDNYIKWEMMEVVYQEDKIWSRRKRRRNDTKMN